jgi:hypothetical protein
VFGGVTKTDHAVVFATFFAVGLLLSGERWKGRRLFARLTTRW